MNAYRRAAITSPLLAEIRRALANEFRRMRRGGNGEAARMIYLQAKAKKEALQNLVIRNLMASTHIAEMSGSVH